MVVPFRGKRIYRTCRPSRHLHASRCNSMNASVRPAPVQAKFKAPLHCRLCGQPMEVLSNFRPTPLQCPSCGLSFTFDPAAEPLPVPGLRLRLTEAGCTERHDGLPHTAPPRLALAPAAHAVRPGWFSRLTGILLLLLTTARGRGHDDAPRRPAVGSCCRPGPPLVFPTLRVVEYSPRSAWWRIPHAPRGMSESWAKNPSRSEGNTATPGPPSADTRAP